MTYNVSDWISHVDAQRRCDDLLAAGAWHGYLNAEGGGPMRGRYFMVRWATPTVCVSHDEPQVTLDLARRIEEALTP